MRRLVPCAAVVAAAIALAPPIAAVTRLNTADGQFWDVQDTSAWAQDSGGIATGGYAYPFNGFGYLKLQVRRPDSALLVRNQYLAGFGLAGDTTGGIGRFDSMTPLLRGDVIVARALFAPADTDYLRYVDSFTNVSGEDRWVEVAWGGAAGAYEDGGLLAVAATSSGDRRIDTADSFVTVMQNAKRVDDPMRGPSGHGPSAHVLGTRGGVLNRVGDMYADPFADRWPGFDPAHVGYVYAFTLGPGQTSALMTFVVKGLSELYDARSRGVVVRDGVPSATGPAGSAPKIPAAGSEIARVTDVARKLVAAPDLRGLTALQRSQIVNWTLPGETRAVPSFSVFEKSVEQLQEALTRGPLTSEDIVRDYVARQSLYDRNGPTFRSILALNTRLFAEARALDAERAGGRVRGPFHGIPVAFKDNID